MGQHGSHKRSGAQGKRLPMAHPDTVHHVLETESPLAKLRDSLHDEAIDLARENEPRAVETLVGLMRGRKTPHSVKRQAARDVIELARDRKIGNPSLNLGDTGSLTINIVQLSDGSVESKSLIPSNVLNRLKDIEIEERPALDLPPSGQEPSWTPVGKPEAEA